MFNLPPGNAVDAEVDLSVGQNQMPFETGVISHYKPRAKTACAHRLVYGGRVVGWLAESDAKQTFVTGEGGRNRLLELSDAHELSSRGATWTASQFTEIARRIPEAFSDPSDVAALLAQGAAASPLTPSILHYWSIVSLNLTKSWALWHLRMVWSFTPMEISPQHPRNWPHWVKSTYEVYQQNSLNQNHFLPIFVLKGANSCLLKQGRHLWPFGANTALMPMLPYQCCKFGRVHR